MTPAIGLAGAATAAGTTGAIVYYTNPQFKQWVDDNILKPVLNIIHGTGTDKKGEPVPGAQPASGDTKNRQDKTTTTTAAGENNNGNQTRAPSPNKNDVNPGRDEGLFFDK